MLGTTYTTVRRNTRRANGSSRSSKRRTKPSIHTTPWILPGAATDDPNSLFSLRRAPGVAPAVRRSGRRPRLSPQLGLGGQSPTSPGRRHPTGGRRGSCRGNDGSPSDRSPSPPPAAAAVAAVEEEDHGCSRDEVKVLLIVVEVQSAHSRTGQKSR